MNIMKRSVLFIILLSISTTVLAAPIGRVYKIRGKVIRTNANSKAKQQLKKGDSINEFDEINTPAKSYIKIIMTDDTIMQLGSHSQFKFEKYKLKTKDDRTATYNLLYGQMRTLIIRKTKKADALKIKTPTVAMGIRGTEIISDVYMMKNKQIATDIALISGKVTLDLSKMNLPGLKTIDLKAGYLFNANKLTANNIPNAISKMPTKIFNRLKRGDQTFLSNSKKIFPTTKQRTKKIINRNQGRNEIKQLPHIKPPLGKQKELTDKNRLFTGDRRRMDDERRRKELESRRQMEEAKRRLDLLPPPPTKAPPVDLGGADGNTNMN